MLKKCPVTVDRLREVLDYDPATGVFVWKLTLGSRGGGRAPAGTIAGTQNNGYGYRVITIDGSRYLASRLAWLWMTNKWPTIFIDHINCDRSDNRWVNLREANRHQNQANSRNRRNNTSGFKGVSFDKNLQRFRAYIWINSKKLHLGTFETAQEAHDAYLDEAKRHHGPFARSR